MTSLFGLTPSPPCHSLSLFCLTPSPLGRWHTFWMASYWYVFLYLGCSGLIFNFIFRSTRWILVKACCRKSVCRIWLYERYLRATAATFDPIFITKFVLFCPSKISNTLKKVRSLVLLETSGMINSHSMQAWYVQENVFLELWSGLTLLPSIP